MRSVPPPGLEDFGAYIRRKTDVEISTTTGPFRKGSNVHHKIRVRRFAGPTAFRERIDHLRIAHLTDLHVGAVTPMKIQQAAIDLTNAASPDLVVITGDFVCHSQRYLDELEALMKSIRAPVIGVLGNHDHWSGSDEVRKALKRAGVLVLDNQHTILTLRHQELQVLGLDDAYTGHADREKALKGLNPKIPTLGLSHIAEEADRLWPRGVSLVLSGHTHAGQITVARLHELSIGRLAGHRYVHGLYGSRREDKPPHGAVYVGAGIGASVMPFRFGERGKRELALFELGHEPGALEEDHSEQPPMEGRAPTEEQKAKRREQVEKKREKRERKLKAKGNGNGNGNSSGESPNRGDALASDVGHEIESLEPDETLE